MASESAPESRRSQLLVLLIAIGLALLAMAFLTLRSAGAGDTHEFVGHNKCKSCHAKAAIGDQYGLWLESRHAKAMTSLATEKAKKWASEAGVADPQTDERCVQCHNDKSPAWDPQRYTLADGRKVGFDYDQAVKAIAHPVPEGYDPMAEGEAD